MGVGDVLRRGAPVLAMAAGTAAVGAAAAYGATRYAGESDGGQTAQLVSLLGTKAIVSGGLAGIASGVLLGRSPLGRYLRPFSVLMIPAGIGGAALGAMLARTGLERDHAQEYRTGRQAITDAVAATQGMFRAAGADELAVARVPEAYDRSYLNASYAPRVGPFGDHIRIGRSAEGGGSLATLDVVAHEFSHKVIHEYAPRLALSRGGDGRAIHESLADTFAMAVDTDDWLVAEDAVPGGMRSVAEPELLGARQGGEAVPAPITREQLDDGAEEHLAAGVGNKVAWRIGEALGRPELARIYVAALERRGLGFNATYAGLARDVRAAATELHGAGSDAANVVDAAWRQAGY